MNRPEPRAPLRSEHPPSGLAATLRLVGPGLVVAATGVGAGDLVAATKAGATYGLPLLWAVALGAILKFALAEGVARWQLATGTTVLEGWVRNFGRPVQVYFLVYLVLWTVIVAAALMAACGLAAHALVPALPVNAWAVIHALAALAFVWWRGYGALERAMKAVIAVMFVAILGSAILQGPPLDATLRGLVIPTVPAGSTVLVMGVVGGIGGTLTLLSYNYWIREKGWTGTRWLGGVRIDLGVGYLLTGLFGLAVVLLAALVLLPQGIRIAGTQGVLRMAGMLGERFGRAGELVFLVGFWGAVTTSILGVWQGVPYLFADYVGRLREAVDGEIGRDEWKRSDAKRDESARDEAERGDAKRDATQPGVAPRVISTRSALYRSYIIFMTFPPMILLLLDRPVWLVVAYAAVGSLFMPFLAVTLLIMNNRRAVMGGLRNGFLANAALVLSLALFLYLAFTEIRTRLLAG